MALFIASHFLLCESHRAAITSSDCSACVRRNPRVSTSALKEAISWRCPASICSPKSTALSRSAVCSSKRVARAVSSSLLALSVSTISANPLASSTCWASSWASSSSSSTRVSRRSTSALASSRLERSSSAVCTRSVRAASAAAEACFSDTCTACRRRSASLRRSTSSPESEEPCAPPAPGASFELASNSWIRVSARSRSAHRCSLSSVTASSVSINSVISF
mmetsp:Transcript_4344/g.7406  ORF Transcript_4344/g.7406 Transcript_4344/m.7406 type:complete len:222 (+) Transcript_4344:1333-1998(+)